jgi:ubiquinone/menaquinone biosynthesis C-methylase UbiE
MTSPETFQIPLEAAEIYEAKLVPAIFAEWAPHTVEAARVEPGDRVLDVACGTGIVARTAAEVVGPSGSVAGIDLNTAMLTVAARVRPDIEWLQGSVDQLPFPSGSFAAVMCQMALMFFPDRRRALMEMKRVTRPGGNVAIVVPASLNQQPAYRQFVDIAARHAGEEARLLLSTYWACGDVDALIAAMNDAGFEECDARTRTGTARFDSADDLVVTEVEGSPLAERIDAVAYADIRRDAAREMLRFETGPGRFEIPLVCHVVSGRVG